MGKESRIPEITHMFLISSSVLFCFLSILLDANNVVKITDFGTCRTFTNQSILMTVIGTYAWMAPEVICKGKSGKKADVW
jgi:hypothetical protein